MARNICSQCHRVLCSSGVSGSQPASHPCYTIYTTNSELEWPKKSVYISGVPAEGHRDLYTSRQLCRQRPPTHSWGGQRNLYTFQECQQRATKTCMHLGNYTTHTDPTPAKPNIEFKSKGKKRKNKSNRNSMELNRNKTGHLRMDDLNLREELVKIIRTHIAKTEDIKMHQVSVLQKDTGNQTQT